MPDKPSTDAEEGWTEVTDLSFDRVDLVNGAANGTSFLIAKSAADGGLTQGLVPPELVSELIAKANATEEAAVPESTTDPVVKADDLDVTEPLADAGGEGDGSAELPGSGAWEAVDAATARKWTSILGRAKHAVGLLADRERMEDGVDPSGDGWSNAWDLDDAQCAIDCAISLLAPYALGEELEAEFGAESELADVAKAVTAIDPEALAVVESLVPLRKAGRVLSAANETAIRDAVDSLQGVLDTLPQAPLAPDSEVIAKAEEAAVPETPAATPVTLDVAALVKGARELTHLELLRLMLTGGVEVVDIAKAKGDAQLAVFDANGKLIGTVDPGDLSPIASTAAEADAAGAETAEGGDDAAAAPADDAAAAAPAETAAPAAEAPAADAAPIPGTDTVQSPVQQDPNAVTKAVVAEALGDLLGPLVEQFGRTAELAKTVESVQERIEKMAARPDQRNSPYLRGATGELTSPPRDPSQADDGLEPLRKAVADAQTDTQRVEALAALSFAEIKARFNTKG